jgi:hypothetical protein
MLPRRELRLTTPSPDALIAVTAARQHGVVTSAQLCAAGLSAKGIAHRVARGTLHRLWRGVYAVGHCALSREGRFLAGVLAAGGGAALSRLAAAQLRELWRYRVPFIDVVAPKWRKLKPPVRIHRARSLDPRDVTTYLGIPVTTVDRMLVDLTDQVTKWELANIIHEAAYRGVFNLVATRDAIERATGRHNLRKLTDALDMHLTGSAGVKSRAELRFLIQSQRMDLPEPLVNVDLNGFEVDFHWPELNLAIELDGPGHRRHRTQSEDAVKQLAWQAAGYQVARFGVESLGAALLELAARVRSPRASDGSAASRRSTAR